MATEQYTDVIIRNTTKLRLIFKTNVNLIANPLATNGAKIVYTKPDGTTTGEWQATVLTGSNGRIYVDFSSVVKLDAEGIWNFWAKLTFDDSRIQQSKKPVKFLCVTQGDVIY